jgi:hypothetical protein
MPRTLQSLRETCQDEDTEYQLSAPSTLVDDIFYPVTNGTAIIVYNVMEYSNYIPKGYYILDYSLAFKYDNSGNFGIITPSSFHNIIDYEYTDILDVENNPVQFSYNIERTNSYLTSTYGGVETFLLANQKMIHIKHNTDDLKIRFKTVEFDGKVEPIEVTGTSTNVQETFSLVEWDTDFNWPDYILYNSVSKAGVSPTDVDQYLTRREICSFSIDEGKDGSVIELDFHYQAYNIFDDAGGTGMVTGPLTANISATKINIYLQDAGDVIITESADINPNDYVGTIRLKATVPAGLYYVYVSGATLTTYENFGNHGWTNLLLSRAGTGAKNSLNTLTQKSIADLRVPVYKTLDIDGSQTTAGTYLSEIIPQGLSNCPGVKFETTSFRANLFRIF